MLEYPQLESFNRFKQTSNPTISSTCEGYTHIHISWTDNDFGGLALSENSGMTFIDGSPGNGNGWHYSIGLKKAWYTWIPGPYNEFQSNYEIIEVNLWVRVPILCTKVLYKRYNNHMISVYLLIIAS